MIDAKTVVEFLILILQGLAGLWLRSIHADFKEMVAKVNTHSEQLAVLKDRQDRNEKRLDHLEARREAA